MSLSTVSAGRGRPVAWPRAGILTVVLLGILGMHGLAAHCPPSGDDLGEVSTVSMGSHGPDQADVLMLGSVAPVATDQVAAPSEHQPERAPAEGSSGLNGMGLVGACIVALVGLGLVLAIARARGHRAWWASPISTRQILTRVRSRLPRPPTLAELSLLRC